MATKKKQKFVPPRNPKLVPKNMFEVKQCPSAFLSEMSLSTQEKLDQTYEMRLPEIIELLDMSEMTHQKATKVDIEETLFQPFPSEVVFQNCEPHQTYQIPLQLRNNDQVARLVKVVQADSPYFKVISPPDLGNKVAPGMEVVFTIQFTPDEKKDYNHELICITEREKFLVPVVAIGARGILDFPDEVRFGVCPVKFNSSKLLLVRNIGNAEAKFQMLTEGPFSVSPDTGLLEVGKNMQIELTFCPQATGSCVSHLIVKYETGEDIYVGLHGDSTDINVRLDKNNVKLDSTFITSASRKTVAITNRSDVIVNYSWKTFATEIEEHQQRRYVFQQEEEDNESQRDEFLNECLSNPSMRDEYALMTRSFKNRLTNITNDQMMYKDENIIIDPIEGEIWPNTTTEITIVFKPTEEITYARTAYLDMTGREMRLPLKLRGSGIGPRAQFSFDTLDVENVFVNSQHSYEIVLENKGDIDVSFSYVPLRTMFGKQLDFSPTQGVVKVGDYQAIQINFSSPHLGRFSECFTWSIEGSSQKLQFCVRGHVIGPTFNFDTKQIKFGTISYGFTYEKTCKLVNTSQIPMEYNLRVPIDGKGLSAMSIAEAFLEGKKLERKNKKPAEFIIDPYQGVLQPLTEAEIQINFTPLSHGRYDTAVVVDVKGVGDGILALPICAKSVVPDVNLVSDNLDLGRCFINHVYESGVELVNESELPAKYELIDQMHADESGLVYESPMPRGIIEAHSTLEIPLHVKVAHLHQVGCIMQFNIFGSTQKSLVVHVTATGEGPVVHINSQTLHFNSIPVLLDSTKSLKLTNESLIPAKFFCQMTRPKSSFRVEPHSAVISPHAAMFLNVTANVNDNLRFQDKLQVHITDGQALNVSLSAQGTGTTIITEPCFGPVWDIGPHLSSRVYQQKFRFVNKGRRSQQIYWMTEGFLSRKFRKKRQHNPDDMMFKNMPPDPDPPRPVFKLIPDRMCLAPGKHQDVILEGFTEKAQSVRETMICQAIVGNNTGKEKIMTVEVQADFIQPLLEFSVKELSFTVIKYPETDLFTEVKQLTIQNISLLPLNCIMKIEYPFCILIDDVKTYEHHVSIEVGNSIALFIQFDPRFKKDRFIRTAEAKLEVSYLDHPSSDWVNLRGDVFYPNLKFEMETVDFGSVLNDTEHVKTVKVTNISPLDVYYTWSFTNHEICFEGKEDDEGIGRDLSDGSDEEKSMMIINTSLLRPQINTRASSTSQRPQTASVVSSNIETLTRPSTAPASSFISPRQQEKYGGITWSEIKAPPVNVGIEEVFDVLPLYGSLKPTESQQFQFTFYGHPHIIAKATAVCSINGGPDYEISLKGQASLMQYQFNQTIIDFGKQLYNQVNTMEIELRNTGKVEFDFVTLDVDGDDTITPCQLNVTPSKGNVAGGEKVMLTVRYIAALPEVFLKEFKVRVGHFEPEKLTVCGEGVFQRITLSLPRDLELPKYEMLYNQARDNLLQNANMEECDLFEWDVLAEMDRLDVKKHNMDLLKSSNYSLLAKQPSKLRLSLIDYVLDFGHVVIDSVVSQVCQLTNVGHFAASCYADQRKLATTGFYADIDRVQGLPGFPDNEFIEFLIVFNPASANLTLGPVETVLPIKTLNGPITNLRLKAYVTMPEISVSTDTVDFSDVVCGQCKVITIQLDNITKVRCDWEYKPNEEKTQMDKHLPLHLKKKMKQKKNSPRIFEIMPPSGSLLPGQKINIQIKFMPTEETHYLENLYIKVTQSSQDLHVTCKGKGMEPHIEFENSLIQFGPILPFTGRDEVTVKVINPCSFPIEFYSLEFDKQYIEEEKVLRTMIGYDEQNTILLPPRNPGSLLPKQLLDHYGQINKAQDGSGGLHGEVSVSVMDINTTASVVDPISQENSNDSKITSIEPKESSQSSKAELTVGDLEITPVSAAIASYLGIDLSIEGKSARNRRGICIIVHGAPLSGKTATAEELSRRYGATLITIDDIVEEAIMTGKSSAALRAKELSVVAARLAKANADAAAALQNSTESKMDTSAAQSTVRKTSVLAGPKGARQQAIAQQTSMALSSPQAHQSGSFISKKLALPMKYNDQGEEEEYYSCVLPDDVLVELIADRLQISDCHQGVIIDGLDSKFTSGLGSAATILLRAINNRKFIFALTLKFDYDLLKNINAKKNAEIKKQEERKEKEEWERLEEMSEDEYESLPEEERARIDKKRLEAKKERLAKKQEQKEREERERKERELIEEKRLEDEKGNKKGRKSTVPKEGKAKDKKSVDKLTSIRESAGAKITAVTELGNLVSRPETSLLSERSGSSEEMDKKRIGGKNVRQKSGLLKDRQITPINELHDEDMSEKDRALRARFLPFQNSFRDILLVFDTWDRTTGNIASPESEKGELEIEIPVAPSISVAKKSDKKSKGSDREKLKEISESPAPSLSSNDISIDQPIMEEEKIKDGIGIPNIILDTKEPQQSLCSEALDNGILPIPDEVMDGIGVGPSGPPVPPEAVFSVVPYPPERQAPSLGDYQRYTFVSNSADIPNAVIDEPSKIDVSEVEKPVVDKKESKKQRNRMPSATKQKGRHSSMPPTKSDSPPPPVHQSSPDKEIFLDSNAQSRASLDVFKHRWVVPAGESTELRISFVSQDLGQFDQTLNFELLGTRRRYQLFCRGVCSFPTLSREPRIVFPNRKKFKRPEEIVHKKFILSSETYEFGPLLAGKNRERYREGRYPENMEQIHISNTSPMVADITFAFLNDSNATTFLLEPPAIKLEPGESQVLSIWAYPKTPGRYEDTLVCCVKENPEPVLFKVAGDGVRPELELDKKTVHFERVLLHRKETRTVYLRNSTLLPVSWKLNGLENLGDDFSVTQEHGTIQPMQEFGLQLHFRAIKPVNIKKIIRLEVSDAENVMGLSHAENISVQAEAYDVALDMSFPKGTDGGLDFNVIRVGEETKQTCSLKNKGKYEISYHFYFEGNENSPPRLNELFTISPSRGTLIQNDRPTQVQVAFKSKDEILIKDQPILKCQIIEPSMGEHGEIIACIPIRISCRSVYSVYSIYPVNDINFGSVLINTKKSRTLTIENKGDFDFRYSISKVSFSFPGHANGKLGAVTKLLGSTSRQGSMISGRSQQIQPQRSRRDSIKGGGNDVLLAGVGGGAAGAHNTNIRLTLSMFVIFPAFGVVLPGSSVTVTVDMMSEISLVGEEEFVIDITERNPKDRPNGIEYRLIGEACLPNILPLPNGIPTIFEEQRIVKNLSVFRYHAQDLAPGSGVYGQDENKFVFYNVIIGHKAKARFKITNPNKVPCDVIIHLKPISNKPMHKITDIYDVDPQRSSIQAHSSVFATVTFQPPSMQSYSCIFEVIVDGLSGSMAKGRSLSFEIFGDGNLPRINVVKPITTNKKGYPIMLFSKLLIGRSQILPIELKNDAPLPCQMEIKLNDPDQCFFIRHKKSVDNDESDGIELDAVLYTTSSKPVSKSYHVPIGANLDFLVEFISKAPAKIAAELRISVVNNPFEDNVIQLIGEGYQESVTIDNIHCQDNRLLPLQQQLSSTIEFDGDDVLIPSSNQLIFGDCMINVPKILNFTLTNHSVEETMRYTWDPLPYITFSPSCGHLPPHCAKDITVTYQNAEAHALDRTNIPCKVETIVLASSINKKVYSWDNTKHVIQWVDLEQSGSQLDLGLGEDISKPANQIATKTKNAQKKKVVIIEPEPSFTPISGSALDLDLFVSANCNFAKLKCSTDRIYFKDTFMLETRMYSFTLKNEGEVSLNYSWCVQPGTYRPPTPVEENKATSGKGRKTQAGSKPLVSRQSGTRAKQEQQTKRARASTLDSRSSVSSEHPHGNHSQMAHSADGRPASAMTMAYEACSITDPVKGTLRGTEDLPFTVEPQEGLVQAGQEATFTVRFSPLEVSEFNGILICSVENISPACDKPIIALHGLSILPWCHFELGESNYISERRNPELRGPNGVAAGTPLDLNTKTLEFECRGVMSKAIRSFFVTNPTNTSYSFQWIQDSIDGTPSGLNTNMVCLTPKGTIEAGKKFEVAFEYTVETIELRETFWRFVVENHTVSVPFLLVAYGTEPNISLDRSHINFKEILIGYTAREVIHILNDEDTPLHFTFDEASRHAPGHVASLKIEPTKGVIEPHSKIPVTVIYKPTNEVDVNFNVICRIKKKSTPLSINVKAQGFKVNMDVLCEDSTGQKIKLSQQGVNVINFGDVEVNERASRQIFITNTGNFGIDFRWLINGPSKPKDRKDAWSGTNPPVTITPEVSTIPTNCKRRCQIVFCPPFKMALKNCTLVLKVTNGPTYNISITGCGVTPALGFSFTSHDFGPCFIYRAGLPVQKKILTITNNDTKDVSIEQLFTNTNYLEVLSTPNVVTPGSKHAITFMFYPREVKQYSEKVGFELNGLSVVNVHITGEGAEMKVEVADPSDRKVNLGVVKVGDKIKKVVRIVNNSLATMDFSVIITPSTLQLQSTGVLSVFPNSMVSLKPKALCDVILQFQPRVRIPKFSEEVLLECAGASSPLFTITGACQGMEIKLDSEAIPFGSVTLGSKSTRKLIMINSGDIGASFSWNVERLAPYFSITPPKGYVTPGMEVPFEITFSPSEVNQDIRCDDIRCSIENGKPLKLILTGSCVAQMPMKEVIYFSTHVRHRDTKSVAVHNKTNQLWTLRPVIDGEFWTGAETLIVEPQQSKNYELVYRPLTMTQDNKKHNGSVFFALPDGSGLMYSLIGSAETPKPAGNVQRDVPCKTNYTEVLTVSNWLRKAQRFRVITELLKPEKPDPATSFKGLDYIDVPSLAKKEHKIHFYAHREGAFSSKVTFKNEQTGEFQFYYVTFKVGSPGTIGSIDLSTPVRQGISHVVTINNPLSTMVNFQTNCNVQDVNLPPQLTVPPQSEGSCTFEYLPLRAGSVTGKLTLQSVDLGIYIYDLNLIATPAAAERAVHFITTLGTSQIQQCKFISYARTRVEYSSKIDSTDFLVERSVNAASAASSGSEVNVDVTFEPSRLGDFQANLAVSSTIGGEYMFPLYGHCLPPKPQGPFAIKAGGSTQIPFKNIFSQTTSFNFHVDNPSFTVKPGETIRAKKMHNIVVSFDGNQGDSKAVRMGRLLVSCSRIRGGNEGGNSLVWTFYLKGVTP